MNSEEKKAKIVLTVFIFFVFALLMAQKINLAAVDLGRHLKNGEIILKEKNFEVLWKNFYSYTYSDFPFVNHHWGSGVVFYLIWQFVGFKGLHLFYIFLFWLAFWLFFEVAWKKAGLKLAVLTSVFLLPLLAWRTEIRPEVFSYLFLGFFIWTLEAKSQKLIWFLPLVFILWVNTHIYFYFGFLVLGVSLIEALIGKNWFWAKRVGEVLVLCFFGAMINPFGVKGVFYPLIIFNNYGYKVLENQSVWYLKKLINYPPSLYFEIAFLAVIGSFVLRLIKTKKIELGNLIIFIFSSLMAWLAVRNFGIFSFLAIFLLASNLDFWKKEVKNWGEEVIKVSFCSLLILLLLSTINVSYWKSKSRFGLGLEKGVEKSALFFKENKAKGPIFNDYDIGSYLVFYLYPQEKVFVDNRPEAYPAEFFEKIYVPMQTDEEIWREIDQKYKFNVIYFYRHDLTDWAKIFLKNREKDKGWIQIYSDDWAVLLVRNNDENRKLIEKYQRR